MYNSINLNNMHSMFTGGYTSINKAEDNIPEMLDQFLYACPPYTHKEIEQFLDTADTIMRLGRDSAILGVLPKWTTAHWYPRTLDYQIIESIKTGTNEVFSAEDIPGMTPDGATFTSEGRVFIGPTKWPVLVLYRDRQTTRRAPDILELHCKYGHPPADKLLFIIQNDPLLQEKFPHVKSVSDLKLFCRICHIANANWTFQKRITPSYKHPIGRLWFFDFKIFHLTSLEGYTCYLVGIEARTGFPVRFFHKLRSAIRQSFKQFKTYLNTTPMWRQHLGPSPISHICLQLDNAPEFESSETKTKRTRLDK